MFLKLERVTGLGVTPYREFELCVSDTVVGDELVIQFLVNQCGAVYQKLVKQMLD